MINFYFILTVILHFIIYLSFIFNQTKDLHKILFILFINILSFTISSFKKSFIKQGFSGNKIKLRHIRNNDNYLLSNYCLSCNIFTNKHIIHCFQCNSCIIKKDHHCIWLNNCIGAENRIFYVIYLITSLFILIERVLIFSNMFLVVGISFFVFIYCFLSIFSILMIVTGQTTREFVKKYFFREQYDTIGIKVVNET
ncbi:Palmitoyltransferase erf2 [Dictyocoela muelleri]|nr:Palmitoyltransferase erf2 [Dictyocoela muelleri]